MPRRKSTNNVTKRPIDPHVLYHAWMRANKKRSTENKTPYRRSTAPRALRTPSHK